MKKKFSYLTAILLGGLLVLGSCSSNDDPPPGPAPTPTPDPSTTTLNVKILNAAPDVDGDIDEMWGSVQKLVGTTAVPSLAPRDTYLNPDGEGIEEGLGLFEPYSGEENDFTLRAGYFGDRVYFLLEWADDDDSKDRQSWYWDPTDKLWKGEHKYANNENDKYYEDKFAFLFPITEVDGFGSQTCYATCHQASEITTPGDKHTRHYLTTENQKIDMWHWKRVRGTYLGQVDDQKMTYVAPPYNSGSNGRHGDETGQAGYLTNSQTLFNGMEDVKVPLWIIPNGTDYYWISEDDFGGDAQEVTAVDTNGVLFYDGGSINPIDGGYEEGSGDKRFPSVTTRPFTEGRANIDIRWTFTGSGWICEFTRLMDTGDSDDIVFAPGMETDFGMAIFDNAAIAHGIKTNLVIKFEQ